MKKNNFSKFGVVRYFVFCAVTVGTALFCIYCVSCQIISEGIKILNAQECPKFIEMNVTSETSLQLNFNKEVEIKNASVSLIEVGKEPSIEKIGKDAIPINFVSNEKSQCVTVNLQKETKIGCNYQICFEAEDECGNSLAFAATFLGYNARMPIMIITEICGGYTKDKYDEYILLRALTDGNIFGLQIRSARYEDLSKYEFPAIEVKAGEYIALHTRTYENQIFCDELGNDIKQNKNGLWHSVRDFYLPGNSKKLSHEYDAIILLNKGNMEILDSLLYTTKDTNEKFYAKCEKIANLAFESKKWKSETENFSPFEIEKKLTATTCGILRSDSEKLFEMAKQGANQNEISSNNGSWKTGYTLHSSKRKSI